MATRTRRRLTDDERTERVEQLNEELTDAVEILATSEGWMRYLAMASRVPTYSARNIYWLALQAWQRGVELSQVAGYNAWQDMGRQVVKDSKCFYVLGPIRRRLTAEQAAERAGQGKPAYDSNGRPVEVIVGWKRNRVFDIGQTIVVDEAKWTEAPAMPELDGDAPEGLWARLVDGITADGFTLDRHEPTAEDGGALAWVRWADKVMWIAPQVSEAEACRRILHEWAHARCDHGQRKPSRAQGEAEADSVAWICGQLLGVDFTEASTVYLAGWLPDDADRRQEMLIESATAVYGAAMSILKSLEGQQ